MYFLILVLNIDILSTMFHNRYIDCILFYQLHFIFSVRNCLIYPANTAFVYNVLVEDFTISPMKQSLMIEEHTLAGFAFMDVIYCVFSA